MSETLVYSESLAAFAPAFVKLQAALPTLAKAATSHHGKYADLAGTIETIKPLLREHGFAVAQPTSGGAAGVVAVTTILLHESGEWMRDTLLMPTGGNGAQGVGSAISYARRYALTAMLSLAADDDDGAAASQQQRQKPAPKPKAPDSPSEALTKRAMAMFGEAGIKERADRLAFTSQAAKRDVTSWSEVTGPEAADVIAALKDLNTGAITIAYDETGRLMLRAAG